MKSSLRSAAPDSAWMPMSPVPPSPAIASTVISSARPVARSPAASPAAAAAVRRERDVDPRHLDRRGRVHAAEHRQAACGHGHDHRPSSALVIARRPMPMPHPAHARLPGSTYSRARAGRVMRGHFAPPVSFRLIQSVGRSRTPSCHVGDRARVAALREVARARRLAPPRPQTAPEDDGRASARRSSAARRSVQIGPS